MSNPSDTARAINNQVSAASSYGIGRSSLFASSKSLLSNYTELVATTKRQNADGGACLLNHTVYGMRNVVEKKEKKEGNAETKRLFVLGGRRPLGFFWNGAK